MRTWKVGLWLAVIGLIALAGGNSPAGATSNPIPFIQGISPVSVTPGTSQATLTVNGANFASNAVVQWNGVALSTTVVTSGQVTAVIPGTDLASATTGSVTVMNPGPPATVSNTAYLTITAPTSFVSFGGSAARAGSGPFQPVVGDFNADGKLDFVVTSELDGKIYFFAGNGDGTFQNGAYTPVGTEPQGIATGDFNGDGIPDVAVVNSGSATLTVLLGSSGSPFGIAKTTPLPSQDLVPFQAAAADFNGDGNLDLAVTCQTSGHVVILLGNGDGTFASNPVSYGTMAQPQGVAVADFNGDGKLDLAVTDTANGNVWVLNGNGDGTFSAGTSYPTGPSPSSVVAADFNDDGAADLAVADLTTGKVSILLNNGNGTFAAQQQYSSGPGTYFLVAADFNGDGFLDLAATTDFANTFNVLLGTGTGTFSAATSFTAGNNTYGIASADFDDDGRLDIVVTNFVDDTVSVLLQSSALEFNPASLTFPGQLVNTRSSAMPLTLTNTGSKPVTFYSILGNDPVHFLQTNNCGTSLAAGASCTFSVTFSPTAVGAVSSTITLRDDAPGNPQNVSLSGTGTAPMATLTPTSLTFSSQLVGTSSAPQTVTLSNANGTAPLTISGISLTGNYSESNNCGGSVAAGTSCVINVTFSPTATGTQNGTLTVTDNSNAVGNSAQSTSLLGTAIAPVATLIPGTLTFADEPVNTSSPGQLVTLTNAGSSTLTITGIKTAGDFGQTDSCGSGTLKVGVSCTITVTFTPTASGTRTGSLTVTDNSNGTNNSNQTVILTGKGTAPVATLAPGSLAYASQTVGSTSAIQTITLSNTGNATLTIYSIAATGDFTATNNCGGSQPANGSCTIDVSFSPSTNGTRTGTLTVTNNSKGATQTASLTGTGAAPEASFSPGSLTFSNQGVGASSAAQTITLTNNGSQPLIINSIMATGDFTATNTCGSSVVAGASCAISVTFKPTAGGTRSGGLSVTDNSNNATGVTQILTLTGTGTVPTATLSPASLPAYAAQAVGTTTAAQTVTLSNTGAATLSITSIAVTGADPSDFAANNTCNGSVGAGASCSVSVTFKPTTAGSRTASLTVTDNSGGLAGSTQTVSLSGTGEAPVVELSASKLTFANQNVGTTSSNQSLTVTNTGTASLSLTSITASGDFSQTSSCGSSLTPGAACTVTVTFKPSTPGSLIGSLLLSDNVSPGSQSVSLTGTGLGSQATFSPGSLTFAGELVGATGAAQTVKLTNSGNTALSVTSVAATGDFSETQNCPASLAAGANCTITVTFKASAAGSRLGTLTVTDSTGAQEIALSGTGQDFSLSSNSTSASVSPGQSVTYTVTLSPVDGLNNLVTLACSGAPSESSCSVTPGSANAANATSVKVTVSTTAPSALAPKPRSAPPSGRNRLQWLLLALFSFAATVGRVRSKVGRAVGRPRLVLAGASLVMLFALGMAACGGGSSSTVTNSNPGTPAGTYSITLTGTATSGAASVSHNLTLSLQVK